MTWILGYPALALAYAFLFLSVILLWFPRGHILSVKLLKFPGQSKIPNWGLAFIMAAFFGLWSKQLDTSALFLIILFAFAVYYSQVQKINDGWRLLANAAVLFLATGLAVHQLPGFDGIGIIEHINYNQDALPYSLYWSFDKVIIGLFILGMGFPLITKKKEILQTYKKTWPFVLALIVIMMLLAYILGYVRFEPKLPASLLVWALSNLLFTCVSEEALFRGFIQKKLIYLFGSGQTGVYLGLVLASVLFGLAHYGGGPKYVFLAMVAGLGYGWVYQVTERIEAAIVTHFSVNLFHFIFFTYPALASAF